MSADTRTPAGRIAEAGGLIEDAWSMLWGAHDAVQSIYRAADAAYRDAADPDGQGISDAEAERRYTVWSATERRAALAEECRDDVKRMLDWLRSPPVCMRSLSRNVAALAAEETTA